MTAISAILALVFYPLLFNLPLNLVRFRWGFRHGLEPMSSEVQETAEAADRAVQLIIYVVLLTFVIFLLHGSFISVYEVGLTTDNWKAATALGALLSYVPLSLGAILLRILPSDKIREEPESRGPLAAWCGLAILGSFSTEFWRAFCIAALLRLNLSAWLAVLVVAVAFGASQLTTSTARAAGAVTFGGIAGFLFVKTGSLLAPLTMSLIAAGAQLYRVRHISSRVLGNLVALEYPLGSQIAEKTQNRSRFNVTCPTCSTSFNPGKVKRTMRYFTCPVCGEVLEYETGRFGYFLFFLCLYGVPVLVYYVGYRNLTLIVLSIGAASVLFFFGVAVHSFFVPPKAQLYLRPGETGLHLTDRPKRLGDDTPKDD